MNAIAPSKPKLPGLANLVLVIILGISLAKLTWLILEPAKQLDTQNGTTGEVIQTQKEDVDYGKLISNQHIFGVIKKKPVVKAVEKKPEPVKKVVAPTKLNLKLHGIVAYQSKKGFALISKDNGSQKVFGKGETIQKGVTVSKILPDKVVLDNKGHIEELLLPKNKSNNTSSSRQKGKGKFQFPSNQPRKKSLKKSILGQQNPPPDLSSFREKVINDPTQLTQIARPTPAMVDGKFIGFRVQPGAKRKFFRQLGFKANDIITEVNGIVLDDASKGASVLEELTQAAELSITVKRGQEEVFLRHAF